MANIKTIIILAFMLSIGALLNIVGCVIYASKDWLPFTVVVMYFLAPIPNVVCEKCFSTNFTNDKKGYPDLGYFLTGFILVSGFGLPLVLLHAERIVWQAAVLSLVGGIIVYATVLAYIHYFHSDEDQ